MAGKGSRLRPVNQKIYGENYDRIFRTRAASASKTQDSTEKPLAGGLPPGPVIGLDSLGGFVLPDNAPPNNG